jgi:hypothetical protein
MKFCGWLFVATGLLAVFSRLHPQMTNSPIAVVSPLKTIIDVYLNIQLVPRSEHTVDHKDHSVSFFHRNNRCLFCEP